MTTPHDDFPSSSGYCQRSASCETTGWFRIPTPITCAECRRCMRTSWQGYAPPAENSRADRNSRLMRCTAVPLSGTEAAGQRPFEICANGNKSDTVRVIWARSSYGTLRRWNLNSSHIKSRARKKTPLCLARSGCTMLLCSRTTSAVIALPRQVTEHDDMRAPAAN